MALIETIWNGIKNFFGYGKKSTGGLEPMLLGESLPIDLRPNCVARWKMDDALATTQVLDSSGNGYHGTAQANTNTLDTTGKIGGALSFNGTSDYVDTNNTFQDVFKSDFSISLWAKLNDGQPDYENIFFGALDGGNGNGVEIWNYTSSGKGVLICSYQVTPGYGLGFGVNTAFSDGQQDWGHIVMSVWQDGENIRLRWFLNAVQLSNDSFNYTPDLMSNYSLELNQYIGGCNPQVTGQLNGALDDVMIFDKALSTDEIAFLYNGGTGTEELYESTIVTNSIIKDSWDWSW